VPARRGHGAPVRYQLRIPESCKSGGYLLVTAIKQTTHISDNIRRDATPSGTNLIQYP